MNLGVSTFALSPLVAKTSGCYAYSTCHYGSLCDLFNAKKVLNMICQSDVCCFDNAQIYFIYYCQFLFYFQLNFRLYLGNASATLLMPIPDVLLRSLTFVLEYPRRCFPDGEPVSGTLFPDGNTFLSVRLERQGLMYIPDGPCP
jgi:hypothetical protein